MIVNSLKLNILASYASQIYLVIISIAILPIYMKYMGAEAYGLVGFFAMIQGIFNLLDFGLTPTISRQTSQFNAGAETALKFRQLFRALSIIFLSIALLGGGLLLVFNQYIAEHWLKLQSLPLDEVLFCLQIMAICVALRWMTGLYRGVVSGFEKIVWLSSVNVIIATLRFPGVLLYMYWFGFNITSFFTFQLYVAIAEFTMLAVKALKLLPRLQVTESIGWSLQPVKPILSFAMTIAFTSSVWVLLTQLDKLVLSGILPLSEYGYFTLAVLVAGGVLQVSAPISTAIMPRMARLYGENKLQELRQVYLAATQIVMIVAVSAGVVLAALAQPVLYVWTGNAELAIQAAPILTLYALGNALLALAAFPYYLQYAKGNLKYHFIGNLFSILLLIPVIIWAAENYGAIGAGWVWLILQFVYLVAWVSYVHTKIEENINIVWFRSFLPSLLGVCIVAFLLSFGLDFSENRLVALFQIGVISVLSLFAAIMCSSISRSFIRSKIVMRFK